MALINEMLGYLEAMGWYVIPVVAVISAIVFFHELGHYYVGRWCGVQIEAFSLGFGPELFARTDKRGTRWRLALFPLGGYVKFLGDANPASAPDMSAVAELAPADRLRTLAGQPVGNRAMIVAAGPIANFILALVLFTGLFMGFGKMELAARVGFVEPGSPADRGGFQKGDVVTAIDGAPIHSFEEVQQAAVLNTALPMNFTVERAGGEVTLHAAPEIALVDQGALGKRRIGHLGLGSSRAAGDLKYVRCDPLTCVGWAGEQISFIARATGAYVVGLFAGRESVDQVSGMIGISQMAGEVAKISLWELVNLAAIFSVSVGLMNLLPVPLLDGGHLLFYAFEAVRGRPLSERVQQAGMRVGIAFVACLVVFTTMHDFLRLFGRG
jgi:regulator of sigma E protease